ncbi:MAG: enoyl-CoA hydratase [Crocinitomicaceae bacterium]|nr:enoyl-CoA hydratase [Crocinitomicaceae bacterium]|tara:strand:+ start:12884 stop:13660 length:777 start_codon:yes stop_codon:yes gene_type:complete
MLNAINKGQVNTKIDSIGIATIEFGHPSSNSLPGNVLQELADTITEFGINDCVKVIMIKSIGDRAFCAGASFDELISIKDSNTGKKFFSGFAKVINACRKCPKFIVGRVQGKAVGGGVGLASSFDYCLATKYADIKLSELAIGIGPFVVGPAVERKIGLSAMSQLTINATEWRSAKWAKEKGLYAEIYDNVEELDKQVDVLLKKLANSNPESMKLLKSNFWKGTENWDSLLQDRASISGELVLSDFTINAINSFKNKK